MTQLDPIIAILERDGQIDNFFCISNKLTLRLAARIADLKARGWQFETVRREDKNTIYHVTKQPVPQPLALFV